MYSSHIYAKPGADTPREFHYMYISLSTRDINAIVAVSMMHGPFGSRIRIAYLNSVPIVIRATASCEKDKHNLGSLNIYFGLIEYNRGH